MTELPEPLRGPWVAILTGSDDTARRGPDDVSTGELVDVAVVRGTFVVPVGRRTPTAVDYRDMLYASDWFSADPDVPDGDLRRYWTRAQAVADALNALAVPEPAAVADLRAEIDRLHTALAAVTTPAGPADADPVWVTAPLNGVDMHRPVDGRTGCDKPTWGGRTTTAANARARWGSKPCPRCWPVTT